PRLHSLIITFCLFFSILPRPPSSPLFPYTTLFRSPSLPLEPVRQRVQRLVIEAGAELARRAEDVGDVIVRGHEQGAVRPGAFPSDRKSTRLNSSHQIISYAVFCLKKKKNTTI